MLTEEAIVDNRAKHFDCRVYKQWNKCHSDDTVPFTIKYLLLRHKLGIRVCMQSTVFAHIVLRIVLLFANLNDNWKK